MDKQTIGRKTVARLRALAVMLTAVELPFDTLIRLLVWWNDELSSGLDEEEAGSAVDGSLGQKGDVDKQTTIAVISELERELSLIREGTRPDAETTNRWLREIAERDRCGVLCSLLRGWCAEMQDELDCERRKAK